MHFGAPIAHCIRCRFKREVCLCHLARVVPVDLRMIVVLHAVEALKMSNTGHLAQVVLPDCPVVIHGTRGGPPVDLSSLDGTHADDGRPWRTVLFFPGLGARPLTPEYAAELRAPDARLRVVIPDGTWSQARRMVKRIPQLTTLPRIILAAPPDTHTRDFMRPRPNPEPGRVSTAEAIATALGLLGEPEAEKALYEVYDAAALRIALMRGKIPLDGHRDVLRSLD